MSGIHKPHGRGRSFSVQRVCDEADDVTEVRASSPKLQTNIQALKQQYTLKDVPFVMIFPPFNFILLTNTKLMEFLCSYQSQWLNSSTVNVSRSHLS